MGTMLGDTARMAQRGAGHAAGGIRDGRTDGQVVIPICQTDPVPKALLQTCQSPSCPQSPLLTPGLSRFLTGQCGSGLALERLFPTDRALSTSVFTEKPNKPLEERSQQPGLCQELGQLHLHPGWSRERTNPPSQGTGIAPSWRNCCLCMEQRPWNSCGTNWERGICGVISTPPAAALRG